MPEVQTGTEFRREQLNPISASWDNVTLRTVLKRIGAVRKVAIVLDRRIDPDQLVQITLADQPLDSAMEDLAQRVDADVVSVGSTYYVGPVEAVSRLRTLIALRSNELFAAEREVSVRRRLALVQTHDFYWNDLDTPTQILRQLVQKYQLEWGNESAIPHDLWASATLAEVNCFEALSLVLIQFDQTFTWEEQAQRITLVPIPEVVEITQVYRLPESKVDTLIQRLREAESGLHYELDGNRLQVRGTVEDQEWVRTLLNPRATARAPQASKPTSLARREFTLRVENVPVQALIEKLEQSGIEVLYDADVLKEAGIDLQERVNINIRKGSADQFFHALCDPLGLEFRFAEEGLSVSLAPKR